MSTIMQIFPLENGKKDNTKLACFFVLSIDNSFPSFLSPFFELFWLNTENSVEFKKSLEKII